MVISERLVDAPLTSREAGEEPFAFSFLRHSPQLHVSVLYPRLSRKYEESPPARVAGYSPATVRRAPSWLWTMGSSISLFSYPPLLLEAWGCWIDLAYST